jgi:tetratricopeptide (TPR) repeat protein
MRKFTFCKTILLSAAVCLILSGAQSTDYTWLDNANKKTEQIGKYQIYSKNDILFCTGDDPAGIANNRAAELMMNGSFSDALVILEDGLTEAPLFFPFRYNAGICTLYLNRLQTSLIHFQKAAQLVPEYSKIYLQTGYIYGRLNRESDALEQFRIGLQKNPRELNTYILIGDIYFERNQLRTAKKYYETTITLQNSFPNGILGLAKIHFKNDEYIKAIVLFKSIDTSVDYDKAYHYYFAESAFKTGDYKTAVEQYETLLKFKTDKFFLVNSMFLIKHKLELSKRFTER